MESAVTAAVVRGTMVAWLQTGVDIRITRKAGKSEFEFRLAEPSSSTQLLRESSEIVARLLGGGPRTTAAGLGHSPLSTPPTWTVGGGFGLPQPQFSPPRSGTEAAAPAMREATSATVAAEASVRRA